MQEPNEGLNFPLPDILWFNTAVILISSWTCESCVKSVAAGRQGTMRSMLGWTMLLGTVFLAGQFWGWLQLVERGFYSYTNVLSGMFYVLTGFHGAHLLAAIIILAILCRGAWAGAYTVEKHQPLRLGTIYWHFLGILWLALFIVLLAG